MAVNPAYDLAFDGFAAPEVRGNPAARQAWATDQMMKAARASANLGLTAHATFSGALAWPFVYPWPQRPAGLIETAFDELARRWRPILDAFDAAGVDVCYEIHPGEDLFDGTTFEMFLARVDGHKRCKILYDPSHFVLQQLDYLAFIDIYHDRIGMFHAKDAEFNPTGRQGVYSGYAPWAERAGRFRSLGDGAGRFSRASSRSSRNTASTAGRCWSGSAASRTASRVPRKGPSSSRRTSSRWPGGRSTTSPRAVWIMATNRKLLGLG